MNRPPLWGRIAEPTQPAKQKGCAAWLKETAMLMFKTLRSRAMLSVGVVLLLILGIAVYRAYERRGADIAATFTQLELQANSLTTHHADLLRNTYAFIEILLARQDVSAFGAGQACSDTMASLLARESAYDNIGLVTPDGLTTCNGRNNPAFDLSDRPYFQQALRESGTIAGEPNLAPGTGNWVLPFARAVRGESGGVEGVLVTNISLPNLVDEAARAQPFDSARIGVVNAAGIVLAHYPDPKRMTGQDISAEPFFQTMLTTGGNGSSEEAGLDGAPRIYAFTRLPETDASPVYVWVSLYKDVVTANADAQFVQAIVLSALIALVCFTLLWFAWNRQVLHPLSAIMDAARRLSAGDYKARSGVRPSSQELGTLATMFDDMAESLASNAEILQLNRALRVLSDCAKNVVRAQDEQELLDGICRTIVESGNYGYCWLGFAENDERASLRIAAKYGQVLDDAVRDARQSWKEGSGPGAIAIRTGQRQVLQDMHTAPESQWRQIALDKGLRSAVALPLHDESGTAFGVIVIFAGKTHVFTEPELTLLDELAEDLTFGILTRRAAQEGRALAEHLAKVDTVTGLPNRVELLAHLEKFIRRASAGNERIAVLSVNVDRLTEVQDAIGIAGVDNVLRQFATRLSDHMGGIHFVARNSGGSIAIVAPLAVEAPAAVARVVHDLAETAFEYAGIPIDMQTTIGVALFPEHGNDADTLLRHADMAVRRARGAGVVYAVYAGTEDSENPQNLIMLPGLRKAVREDQLVLFYQPKVSTLMPAVIGVEALVRWRHPERGMIPPGVFIPLAERTGIIKPLTYWVIGAALRQLARWQRDGGGTRIAVNVSQNNLRDPDFFEQFIALPEKNGAKLEGLDIELTESALMEDPTHTRALLQRLSDLGVRIFIDDFGTGYSSLAYLATLPIHALKIDRSFVIQMDEPRYRTIVESTISMAHSLGMKVVAEGAETAEVVVALTALGCDEIQGYVYSKPLPVEELDPWCARFGK
jgi:diguanylate cyclase